VTTTCELKICDFGLARVVEPHKILASSCQPQASSPDETKEPEQDGLTAAVEKQLASAGSSNSTSSGDAASPSPQEEKLELMPKPSMKRMLTTHVVTRWYRCPELILLEDYTSAVSYDFKGFALRRK